MEAAGLGIGIVGLAGLFGTCLEIIGRIDSYKDFGVESDCLFAQFEADRVRFRQWGQSVGIDNKDDHHKALDDPTTRSAVDRILKSIKNIDSDGDNGTSAHRGMDYRKRQGNDTLGSSTLLKRHVQFKDSQGETSRSRKIGWALRGKAKFITLVGAFDALVQKLHDLVPPGRTTTTGPLNDPDKGEASNYLDTQRFLALSKKNVENELRRELDKWLDTCDTHKMYDNFVHKRQEHTCDWILDRSEFLQWHSSELDRTNLLWVNGPPGYGKTILCARMIQHLSSTSAESPLAYFFFSSELERRADSFLIMRSWISQIIRQSEQAFDFSLEKSEAAHGRTASNTDIEELFKTIVQTIPGCIFIVDGLDECAGRGSDWDSDHRESLTGFLTSLRQATAGEKSRVMIVSRDIREIRECLRSECIDTNWKLLELQIRPEDVKDDAVRFSRKVVSEKLANKTEEQREQLSERIVDRCEAMFLAIRMLEDELSGGKNFMQLQRIIDQAPHKLEHVYDRNWERITSLRESRRLRAFSILRWATFGLRPITVLEITEALLLADEECDELSYDELPDCIDAVYIKSEILDLCGSLVETRGAESDPDLGSLTIHLTHFSVRQYILSHMLVSTGQLIANERLRYSNEAVESNIIARTCLRYLNSHQVWEKTRCPEIGNSLTQAFRTYASKAWYQHVKRGVGNSEEVISLMNTFFSPGNENWESWRKNIDHDLGDRTLDYDDWILIYDKQPTSGNPLFYASLLGCIETMTYLLEEVGLYVNQTDKFNQTALLAASSRGWVLGVSYLLQMGADVTIQNSNWMTPVYVAALNGHIEVIKLLLAGGANLMIATRHGTTPLHAAVSEGHHEAVRFIIEDGADPMISDDFGWTPLHFASRNGYIEIVNILLEKDVDLMSENQDGETPLCCACRAGHAEVVQLLLEKGADPLVSRNGLTTLQKASRRGHTEIVKLLPEKGADITVQDNFGNTPLHTDSGEGYIEIATLLLKKVRI